MIRYAGGVGGRAVHFRLSCDSELPVTAGPTNASQNVPGPNYVIHWPTPLACNVTQLPSQSCARGPIPKPTPDQLQFQEKELGALVCYQMATADKTQGCPAHTVRELLLHCVAGRRPHRLWGASIRGPAVLSRSASPLLPSTTTTTTHTRPPGRSQTQAFFSKAPQRYRTRISGARPLLRLGGSTQHWWPSTFAGLPSGQLRRHCPTLDSSTTTLCDMWHTAWLSPLLFLVQRPARVVIWPLWLGSAFSLCMNPRPSLPPPSWSRCEGATRP